MERLLPGVDLLVRQQHQHPRGRHAPVGLPLGADADAERRRARQGPAQGEGREPLRRGRPRGPHRGDLGEARRPAVRGPDQDQARQPADRGPGQGGRQPLPQRVPRGEPGRRPPDPDQGRRRRPRPRRRPQGARPHPAQVGARELDAAGQARGLLGQGPARRRALHRRGRLGRRLGQAGPRPPHPGRPAAARQDHQRREEPHRQGAGQQRDPGADHGDRHRGPRRVQDRGGPLPQGRPDDGRRRRRRAHPHPRPHVPLPPDARPDRGRLRLHRQAAPLQAEDREQGDLDRARVRARGAAAARQARRVPDHGRRRQAAEARQAPLAGPDPPLQGVRGLALDAAGRVRPRGDRLHLRVAPARVRREDPGGRHEGVQGEGPEGPPVHHGARQLRQEGARGQGHPPQERPGARAQDAEGAVRDRGLLPAGRGARQAQGHRG